MNIPVDMRELLWTCPECLFTETPDIVAGHLVEEHNYTVGLATEAFEAWMKDFAVDEDGDLVSECGECGAYLKADSVYGCLHGRRLAV